LTCCSNNLPGERVFSVFIENEETKRINNLDIFQVKGGKFIALTKTVPDIPVADDFLTIAFQGIGNKNPKISAIEVIRIGDHSAHAVIGGPYWGVDVDGDGYQNVTVNAIGSHAHDTTNGEPNKIISYLWRNGDDEPIGTGVQTNLNMSVGDNEVTLTVVDNTGSISYGKTIIHVKPVGYPVLFSLSPATGSITGGTTVTITGQDIGNVTSVRFGPSVVTSGITVVNSGTIQVQSPGPALGTAVKVTVNTTRGESNPLTFTYIGSVPILFDGQPLLSIDLPTAVAFGPDGKLYVGSESGNLTRLTLNDAYDGVVDMKMVNISGGSKRAILGIAFDPLETPEMGSNINVYISTSLMLQNWAQNSAGDGINGKVQRVWGANLENIADVVTGLPVSRYDHAVSYW
jgi:IPT/TIG domain/Malectin domain